MSHACRSWLLAIASTLACQPGVPPQPAPRNDAAPREPTAMPVSKSTFAIADLTCSQWPCTYLVRVEADGRPSAASSTAPSRLGRLAVDERQVVWAESISFSQLRRARVDTLEPIGPLLGAPSSEHPEDLVLVADRIFVADPLGVHEWQAEQRWQTLAPGDTLALAARGEALVRTHRPGGGPTGVIERWPIAGGDPIVLARDEHRPGDLASCELGLVWLDVGQDQPGRVRLLDDEGTLRTLVDDEHGPVRLAASGETIAWIDRREGERVVRVWRDDRTTTLATIADATWRPWAREAIAIRADEVLWSSGAAISSASRTDPSPRERIAMPAGASLIDFALAGDALILAIEFAGPEPIRLR